MDKIHVLILEHEERVSRLLCRIMKRMGFKPVSADNYEKFKTIYVETKPEIILLSLDIPAGDHNELCSYLVEHNSNANIVLLSNMDEDKLTNFIKTGKKSGLKMGGILRKPIDVDAVKKIFKDQGLFGRSKPLKKNGEFRRLLQMHDLLDNLDLDQFFKTGSYSYLT